MGKKKQMSIDDHTAMGQELKIARDALQKAVVIAYRTHGKTKELSGMISMVLEALLRVLAQGDAVFFQENPHWGYSPYYGELFERRRHVRPGRVGEHLIPDGAAPPGAGRPWRVCRPGKTCRRTRR